MEAAGLPLDGFRTTTMKLDHFLPLEWIFANINCILASMERKLQYEVLLNL